jgi:hypothetical protein
MVVLLLLDVGRAYVITGEYTREAKRNLTLATGCMAAKQHLALLAGGLHSPHQP